MLKMPYEDPSNAEDFKPLGPPKRRPKEQPNQTGTLKPTPTPGVYENTKTGKLETDIPENKRVGLAAAPKVTPCKYSPTKEKTTSESSPEKLSSDPQLSGKSSIAEISLPSGLKIKYSPSCQETPRLVSGSGKELGLFKTYFSKISQQIRDQFLFCRDTKSPIWYYYKPGVICVFKDSRDQWWIY